ncbi:hypothetical protein [Paramicrobacterium chengjingii]|uniref:Lipoprotein n=1 Tax=Paramicrobacterium chengjingii TaxID=2769067 RepID=A0ABX6YF87_9MICO|nr:hypothetical protein [Microbacterium chengjingii]QPZ37461.1 hypothetical protein HCR76_11515 [Microbacterium chengjingii]
MRFARRRISWLVPLAALFALSACSAPSSGSDSTGAPDSSEAASPSPSGSVTIGCDLARPDDPGDSDPGPDDLIVGPLVYLGAVLAYQGTDLPGTAPVPDDNGVTYFKTGADLPPDKTVTVSVGDAARSYAGIVIAGGPSAGYSSVTYVSCPTQQQPSRMWWAGGFALIGRQSACVPLDVHVKGESEPRHLQLSLAVDPCDQ